MQHYLISESEQYRKQYLKLSYENYKEGVQINFSTGYIDPDDMMAGHSYPPINQTQQNLYDEEAPYQDKEQLLRFEDGQE